VNWPMRRKSRPKITCATIEGCRVGCLPRILYAALFACLVMEHSRGGKVICVSLSNPDTPRIVEDAAQLYKDAALPSCFDSTE